MFQSVIVHEYILYCTCLLRHWLSAVRTVISLTQRCPGQCAVLNIQLGLGLIIEELGFRLENLVTLYLQDVNVNALLMLTHSFYNI